MKSFLFQGLPIQESAPVIKTAVTSPAAVAVGFAAACPGIYILMLLLLLKNREILFFRGETGLGIRLRNYNPMKELLIFPNSDPGQKRKKVVPKKVGSRKKINHM